MADDPVPDVFGDVVSDVVLVNGVFRLTLAEQEGEKRVRTVARILVPAERLAPLLKAVGEAVRDIAGQAKSRAATPAVMAPPLAGELVGEPMVSLPAAAAARPAKPARNETKPEPPPANTKKPAAKAPDKKRRGALAKLVDKARGKAKKPGKKR